MKQMINADPYGKVTLQGYDPVAFHALGSALRGNPMIVSEYGGYKYLFSSEEHKELFEKDTETYLPAYGGFCAFGVSLGVLFPVEIDTWEIIDGRLVLQFNDFFKQEFAKELNANIKKADENWIKLSEQA